jgi:Tol biopolymer transport system component
MHVTLPQMSSDPFGWVLPLTASPPDAPLKPLPLLQTPVGEARRQFSPDGRWIAYQSLESGENKLYVAPFDVRTPLASPARQISAPEAAVPRWGKDGKEIFYVSRRRLMAAVLVFKESAVEVGKEREVIVPGAASIHGYDVSPDANRFVLKLRSQEAGSRPMTVVQNWAPAR